MTSEEIQLNDCYHSDIRENLKFKSSGNIPARLQAAWLKEIAYQLAVLNEQLGTVFKRNYHSDERVEQPVCSICGAPATYSPEENVWRHSEPVHAEDNFLQTFCNKYGYPIDIKYDKDK